MAKKKSKNSNSKRGLGRGLDSLIPKIEVDTEEKTETDALTLEDILSNSDEEESESNTSVDDVKPKEEKVKEHTEKVEKKTKEETNNKETTNKKTAKIEENIETKEEVIEEDVIEETIENDEKKDSKKTKKETEDKTQNFTDYELASIEEVKEIIEKNPRITLWSTRSSAVLRFLRKTRPEFSISKESSDLIDEAVSKKYPEIWELFEDL